MTLISSQLSLTALTQGISDTQEEQIEKPWRHEQTWDHYKGIMGKQEEKVNEKIMVLMDGRYYVLDLHLFNWQMVFPKHITTTRFIICDRTQVMNYQKIHLILKLISKGREIF